VGTTIDTEPAVEDEGAAGEEAAAAEGESTAPGTATTPSSRGVRGLPAAAGDLVRRHQLFALALLIGALPRLGAVLGYRPAMWFNDAFEYLGVARRFEPYPIRPNGYSAMLRVLQPFHSFALVTVVQHLMGLVIAGLLYALLRRWGLPAWLATLGALPQLLDGNQVQLEHVILSDTLFLLLLVGGLVLVAWRAQPTTLQAAAAGLLLAGATLTRVVGLPLLLLACGWLVVRRVGWRPVVAFLVLAAVPLVGYASWFKAEHGQFALTTSDGVFLYSRVAIFADCDKIHPPKHLAMICEDTEPDSRGDASSDYLWHPTGLNRIPGTQQEPMLPLERFSADRNTPAGEFARKAILAQPFDYLRVGTKDIVRTFQWGREAFPNAGAYSQFPFGGHLHGIPKDRVFIPGATAREDTTAYEHGKADTRRIQPFADWMAWDQKLTAVRGPFLLVILLVGTAGVVLAVRYRKTTTVGGPLGLFWLVAMALVVIPPFTAQYDLRYVIPAVPTGAVAAACAVFVAMSRSSGSASSASLSPDGSDDDSRQSATT